MPLSLLYCLSVQGPGNLKTSIVYHGAPININTYATQLADREEGAAAPNQR